MQQKLILSTLLFFLYSCSNVKMSDSIEEITIILSPVFDSEMMLNSFSSFEELLKNELIKEDIYINSINVEVAISTQAAVESLASGSALIAYINPYTYLQYEHDGLKPLAFGNRYNVNVDSFIISEWNDESPLKIDLNSEVPYYYGLMVLGPSNYGNVLKDEFNENGVISWNSLSKSTICIGNSPTQTVGYIYPSIWLFENYGKSFDDFKAILPLRNPKEILSGLAAESCDIAIQSSWSRTDSEKDWLMSWERKKSVWDETLVVGVTDKIENSLFAISTNNADYTENLENSLSKAFIKISKTTQGKLVFASLNLTSLSEADGDTLMSTKKAFEFTKNIND